MQTISASLALTNPTDKLFSLTRFLANSDIHVFAHSRSSDSVILSHGLDPTIFFKLKLAATSFRDPSLYSTSGQHFLLLLVLHNVITSCSSSLNYEVLTTDPPPGIIKYSLAQAENAFFNVSIFFFLRVLEKSLFGFWAYGFTIISYIQAFKSLSAPSVSPSCFLITADYICLKLLSCLAIRRNNFVGFSFFN